LQHSFLCSKSSYLYCSRASIPWLPIYLLIRFVLMSNVSLFLVCYSFLNIDNLCFHNQVISDFAFLPFGGGPRKCVGDQFALMESTVALTMLLQNFDVELKGTPESVELVTGATIHTKNGLWCNLRKRSSVQWHINFNILLVQNDIKKFMLFKMTNVKKFLNSSFFP
jgi:hypothetical protein